MEYIALGRNPVGVRIPDFTPIFVISGLSLYFQLRTYIWSIYIVYTHIALDNPILICRKIHGTYSRSRRIKIREKLREDIWERRQSTRGRGGRNSAGWANCNWCNLIQRIIRKYDIKCQYLLIDIESCCHTSPIVVHLYMDEGSILISSILLVTTVTGRF
jgi:hypothetical protein